MGGNTGSWGTQIDVHDPQISQFKQTHNKFPQQTLQNRGLTSGDCRWYNPP